MKKKIQKEKDEQIRIEKERIEKIAAKERKERESIDKLDKDHDDISGVTWYSAKKDGHYHKTNDISFYFGRKDDLQWLRFKVSYVGDDWIFFKRIYLSYEGNTEEIIFNEYRDKKTDNGKWIDKHGRDAVQVFEWVDTTIDDSMIPFLEKFSKSDKAKYRLSGKYTRDIDFSKNERNKLSDVLEGYKTLKKIKDKQ